MMMKKPRTDDPRVSTASGDRLLTALICGALEQLGGADVLRVLRTSHLLRRDPGVLAAALRCVASDPRWRWLEQVPLSPMAIRIAWGIQSSLLSGELMDERLYPFLLPVSADGSPATGGVPLRMPTQLWSASSAHWGRIQDAKDGNSDGRCALCEACVASVCAYRDATDAFMTEFECQLTQHEDEWEAQGRSPGAVSDESFAFQQRFFASEPFYSAYVANQDDAAVLAHVWRSGRFPIVVQGVATEGVTTETALSAAARETCRRVYRPVRRLLTQVLGDASPPLFMGTTVETSAGETETEPWRVVAGVRGDLAVGFVLPRSA